MSYYDDEPRSRFGLFVALTVIVLCLLGYFAFSNLISQSPPSPTPPSKPDTPPPPPARVETVQELQLPEADLPETTPEQSLVHSGLQLEEFNPENLLKKIGDSLQEGKFEEAVQLIGRDQISPETLARLKTLHAQNRLQLNPTHPIIEIGELDRNRRSRYALNFGEEHPPIYFDLIRKPSNGKWSVAKLEIPNTHTKTTDSTSTEDSLGIAHRFLHAALSQQFELAKSFVDSSLVTDAKIAGLCIIFEEAKYQLPKSKALRAMFNRDLAAAFKARVQTHNGERAAEFGLNLQRETIQDHWLITEINLQSLLSDYAQRIAGGDVHFTPLVKSPTGGDTLILYFGFDEDGLTPRTRRQLDIVVSLLKTDPNKKLTLSGHTDALGTDNYNEELSARRATAVEKYLLSRHVPPSQIKKIAEGERKPRLPNTDATGQDQPSNRRANRRTEIYLDF